jgi:hypothetical protein
MTDTNWREDMPALSRITSTPGCVWFALQIASPPVNMFAITQHFVAKSLIKRDIVFWPFTRLKVEEESTP